MSDTARVELPGIVELLLGEWAQSPTCIGGRADDALINLSTATGKPLGTLTLGWFREHTSVALVEEIILARRERADDEEEAEGGDDV